MSQLLLRIARIAGGVVCLIVGFVGLFLPFIQGILFLVIGLTLLSTESDRARRWLEWLKARVQRKQPSESGSQTNGLE